MPTSFRHLRFGLKALLGLTCLLSIVTAQLSSLKYNPYSIMVALVCATGFFTQLPRGRSCVVVDLARIIGWSFFTISTGITFGFAVEYVICIMQETDESPIGLREIPRELRAAMAKVLYSLGAIVISAAGGLAAFMLARWLNRRSMHNDGIAGCSDAFSSLGEVEKVSGTD